VVSESRAGPLQLVDEGDQVIHGRSAGWARSGRVARRGGAGEIETRSRKKEGAEGRRGEADRPAASRRRSLGSSCGLEMLCRQATVVWCLEASAGVDLGFERLRGEEMSVASGVPA
jgi:hypothetical protein